MLIDLSQQCTKITYSMVWYKLSCRTLVACDLFGTITCSFYRFYFLSVTENNTTPPIVDANFLVLFPGTTSCLILSWRITIGGHHSMLLCLLSLKDKYLLSSETNFVFNEIFCCRFYIRFFLAGRFFIYFFFVLSLFSLFVLFVLVICKVDFTIFFSDWLYNAEL